MDIILVKEFKRRENGTVQAVKIFVKENYSHNARRSRLAQRFLLEIKPCPTAITEQGQREDLISLPTKK